jgi:hypothetical protein
VPSVDEEADAGRHQPGIAQTLDQIPSAIGVAVRGHEVLQPDAATRVVLDEGNQKLNAALTASQAGMLAWNDAQRAAVNGTTANLQATGDTASFAAQMNAQREAAKRDADAQIDNYYNNAIAIGMQYPETQPRILASSNYFGTFVSIIVGAIGDFFTNIVNQIIQWIAAAVAWIEQAAQDIANWFENAASDIGDFFSGLF